MGKKDLNFGGRVVGETVVITEDISLAGAAAVNLLGFDKNSPVRLLITDFHYIQNAVGPAASSTIQLRLGDGATSESFTVVSNALAVGTAADKTLTRAGTMSDAGMTVEKNESLNIVAVASSGTHTGTVVITARVLGD